MANSAFSDATHSFNSHNNVSVTSVATNDILKFDGTNWVNTTIAHSTINVTQSSHGFSVGEALKSSGSNGAYAKAQADSAANAEVVGVVTVVTDTNNFTLTLSGMVTVAGAVPNETAGTALFLSASSAGALTATEPSTSGQISKPVAIVTTANAAMILVTYRGETISTGVTNWDVNGLELILDTDGDTTLHANTDDQIDVKISGADDFRFTANNFNVLSGSTITIDSGATITNSGTANGFGSGAALTGSTNNTVTTVTGANAITGEANLTFDGTNLTVGTGNVIIGTSGKGIDFSAASGSASGSQSALFDDYEEGTFTPHVWDSNKTTNANVTYSNRQANYTKIGKRVFFNISWNWSNLTNNSGLTGSSNAYVGGLPFTAGTNPNGNIRSACSIGYIASLAMPSNCSMVQARVDGNRADADLTWTNTSAAMNITYTTVTNLSQDGIMDISGHYEVA